MGFNLQAEGLNGVNVQTSIIAGHDWKPNLEEGLGAPVSTVVFVSGFALDSQSPANVDALTARGRLVANGVTGFGGDIGGAGVVGVAGGVVSANFGVAPVTGQTVGVFGTGVAGNLSAPAIGVLGQGGPASPGVVGQGGTGNADGVQGFGHGTFTGVVGFGDAGASGTGVLGFGGAINSATNAGGIGVRGIGAGAANVGPPQLPGGFPSPVGVFGIGGGASDPGLASSVNAPGVIGVGGSSSKPNGVGNDADGVQGFGVGHFTGVVGFGDANSDGTGVVGFGGGANSSTLAGPGVRGIGGGSFGTGPTAPLPNANGSSNAAGVFGRGGLGGPGSNSTGADGVQGVGVGFGAGVAGYGSTVNGNIATLNQERGGIGVYGQGGTTTSLGGGVLTLPGVVGIGGTGVSGTAVGAGGVGVEGVANGAGSTALSGASDVGVGLSALSNAGVGVLATGNIGRGGVFRSNSIAALQIAPRAIATPQGVVAGELGDLFVTENASSPAASGHLWFCGASGDAKTAKWVKIA